MFLAYKALVEKQSVHQIIKLRSDNGGEYVNNKFTTFCTDLKEMANCMIQSKGLSLQYWAEVITVQIT